MATYVVQAPVHRPAAAITLQAPGGTTGDLAPTGSGLALMVNNGATPTTVTLAVPAVDGMTVTFPAITIAATSSYLIPLPASLYGAGTVAVTYGNITTLTGSANTGVAVVTVPGS
jgi:hypothetical protein